ncbi:MAG: homoserine dehydrogenase [Ezakiella sp.]|nr:homoserine dehydrogenase [Ezakiella sp.]
MIIGLMGYGNIGSGVYEVIKTRCPDMTIKKILVKHIKDRGEIFTTDVEDLLNDPEIETVVNTISESEAHFDYSIRALKAGKNLVTSSKEVVSKHLPELMKEAEHSKVKLGYEATVGAGIPWVNMLSEYTKINKISEIFGNMNGTTNFILDLMKKDGIDFDEALLKSRMLRYQEPDYLDDITGIDSRNKLAISIMLAFNMYVDPNDIPTYGIQNIRNLDFGFFERHKLIPKLMSYACLKNGRLATIVAPVLYKNERLRSNVGGNNNLLGFTGDIVGKVEIIGQGAGKFSAANGVVLDLIHIKNGKSMPLFTPELAPIDETIMSYKFYFSFDQTSYKIERVLLPYVHSIYETNDSFVLTTRAISLDTCIELLWKIEQTEERFFFAIYEDLDII